MTTPSPEALPETGAIRMYTTPWCGYCKRLIRQLKKAGIPFDEIDIEQNPSCAEYVEYVNDGNRTVPTVVYSDGTTATNPSMKDVKKKLEELGSSTVGGR